MTMKRPSSTSNSSSSTIQNNFENDKLLNAKTAFLNRVSDGISYLIHRHGYSRARATNLILTELRKEDPLPSDDEVFEVMQKFHLGMDDASKAIIISNAFSKQIKIHQIEPSEAIERLTSNLTTMKLLSKIESTCSQRHQMMRRGSSGGGGVGGAGTQKSQLTQNVAVSAAKANNQKLSRTASWQSIQSITEKSNDKARSSPPPSLSSALSSSSPVVVDQNQKKRCSNKSSTNHKPPKKTKQTAPSSSDVDVVVAQKVILQKTANGGNNDNNANPTSSSSAPSTSSTAARNSTASPKMARASKRDLESIVQGSSSQQPNKRQRLDSI